MKERKVRMKGRRRGGKEKEEEVENKENEK